MRFDPIFPLWLIILVLIPFTIYFFWKEWRLTHRFKHLRCLAVLLMMLSVSSFLLQPKYSEAKSSSILLLTPEYSETDVDSILRSNPDLTIMHIEHSKPYKNSQILLLNDLPEHGKEILFVVGQGLPAHALDLLNSKNFVFIPASSPQGITTLYSEAPATIYRKNLIVGTVNTTNDSSLILLSGPGGKEDSVLLQNKGLNNFKFSFVPKQSGNLLYQLTIRGGATEIRETLPIHVEPARSLNILFLQHYPTFEIRYLKNLLGKKKHRVVLRYQVSKNNFRHEYLNHDPIQINILTTEALAGFDLLITDHEALDALSSSERDVIKNSIQSGLGLLNMSSAFQNKRLDIFAPFKTVSVKKDTTVLKVGSEIITSPARALRVVFNSSITPVQKNKSGILSGYTFDGAGKIGFQFLQETYRLTLSGDSSAYSEIWTPLIEQISKPQPLNSKIKIVTPFPWYENEPIDIQIISSNDNPGMRDDSVQIPLREDVVVDNVWHGRIWGASKGWHTLQTENGASLSYYISQKENLRSLSIANQIETNRIWKNDSSKTSKDKALIWKDIPPMLFYLLFLISAGFLWVAPKL